MFQAETPSYLYDSSWGTASMPEIAGQQLDISSRLREVPRGGFVADIGAGVGLSLASFIFTRRPDITTISVDPGFRHIDDRNTFVHEVLDETVESFTQAHKRELLARNKNWALGMVSAAAEALPLPDESVDLVVSYASLPMHVASPPDALDEAVRILKPSRSGLFGPMNEWDFEDWSQTLEAARSIGRIASWNGESQKVMSAMDYEVEAFFTSIQK